MLLCTNQLATSAHRESVIERHTHHGESRFPPAHDTIEDLIFLARQGTNPVVGDATLDIVRERLPVAPRKHHRPQGNIISNF